MSDNPSARQKLFIPSLAGFYALVAPLGWPLVRFGCGWLLVVHGWGKWVRGMEGQAEVLAKSGFAWGVGFAWFLFIVEFVGGIAIIAGLTTRFWAAAVAIEMGVLTFYQYWSSGFSWLNRGYEFTLLWGIICLAIAFRGGAEYSLDRALGREL